MKRASILTSLVCLLSAVATTGCGDPKADYLGVYATDGDGEIRLYVDGYTYRFDATLTENINIVEGTTSDLSMRLSGECSVQFDLGKDGDAYVVVGSTCTQHYDSDTEKWTFQSGSARISRNGQLDVTLKGDVTYTSGSQTYPGDFQLALQLTRVAH